MSKRIQRIVEARWFQATIVLVIFLAGVLAGLETDPIMMRRHGSLLHALDKVVLAVFIIELALKMGAHGRRPWLYFRDGWNVFDFIIVVICCLPTDSPFAAVLRLARGLRLLRLVTALPKLQLLVGALLKSLGAMGYVGLLLALMFYIFGVAGVNLFGRGAPEQFGTLGAALFSLFQVITLDNWSDIFRAAQEGAPVSALVYFVTFILLGTMIMLNLFIGIIMNSMSEMHAEIAERERARHERETGAATLEDELKALEQELLATQTRLAAVRRRWSHKDEPDAITRDAPVPVRRIANGEYAA